MSVAGQKISFNVSYRPENILIILYQLSVKKNVHLVFVKLKSKVYKDNKKV